jgi:hypothetical protein
MSRFGTERDTPVDRGDSIAKERSVLRIWEERQSTSVSKMTKTQDVLTLLGKSWRSISNVMGERFTRGMYSVSLAFKHQVQDRFLTYPTESVLAMFEP